CGRRNRQSPLRRQRQMYIREENMLALPLLTSMYLGDRWEYLFRTEGDDFAIRAYGSALRDAERCHLALPVSDLWIFPKG
ncbi:hypothetical protein PIA91_02700, partial [Klebsiella michiganensis]|nr:hypothetical protein [Klebsiella michiganensis]